MSEYTQPLNKADLEETNREDEKYIVQFLKQKAVDQAENEQFEDEEAFADAEIRKEMKRLAKDTADESDEPIEFSDYEDDDESKKKSEGDFFSDEDLEDVSEMEMSEEGEFEQDGDEEAEDEDDYDEEADDR